MITDNSNKEVWRWDSDPFGTTAANEDPDGDGVLFTYNLRFPGQYFDEETGRHYNYFRDYDPATGRYIQSDPTGLDGGLNTYMYANANPSKYIDPKGNVAVADDVVVIGVTVAVGACIATNCTKPISDAIENTIDAIKEMCSDDDCPPCRTISGRVVPVGTIAYRPLDIIPDNEMQHGVYGSHHNIFIAKQAPRNSSQPCRCQWQKQKYVLKPNQLTPDMIPIEPFVY